MPDAAGEFTALLARGRTGDREALAQLARQYESKVRLVARVLLGTALRPYLDSVDLVQSVHRSLLLGLRESKFAVSSPEQLVALATMMVRRKVARKWRHVRRQQRLESGSAGLGEPSALLTSLTSAEADPARAAQSNDSIRSLWDNLDAPERRLMELRLNGYNTDEIVADMGINAGAYRARMTRLRQRLRAAGVFDDWL
jgi:RNA polymerase sigma factor (sigma-70 family)